MDANFRSLFSGMDQRGWLIEIERNDLDMSDREMEVVRV
jgi:hypothetical protein